MTDLAAEAPVFPITDRNRVKRVHERGSYDHASVFAILDAGMLCHVSYVIDGQPYCTPTLFWREEDWLYWHGSSASRMLRSQRPGVPACLTVSQLDGLVLARSGFHHSVNYRAAMCFGTAHIIDDAAEKAEALDGVVNRLFPGRAGELRFRRRRRRGGLHVSRLGRRHSGDDGAGRSGGLPAPAARHDADRKPGRLSPRPPPRRVANRDAKTV